MAFRLCEPLKAPEYAGKYIEREDVQQNFKI